MDVFEGPAVGVLMDVGQKVNKLNERSEHAGLGQYGSRWNDYPINLETPLQLQQRAMDVIAEEPECWYADLAASLMLAVAANQSDLEEKLVISSAILTAWIADLRSRSTSTTRISSN